jgi:hypothetical protein
LCKIDAAVAQLTPEGLPFAVVRRIEDITDDVFAAADASLNRLIDHRPQRTLAGAAVKLRLILREDPGWRSLRQVLALIERLSR